jgi:Domain of unknown function (DU1801)
VSPIRSLDAVNDSRPPAMPTDVAAAFSAFPAGVRARLLEVRELIFETAAAIEGVGPISETLKWGEPAYLTQATGSGTTVRLGRSRSLERKCAVLFNCRTTLVDDFRSQFPDVFAYEKNRAILLDPSKPLPEAALSTCLGMALTYHRRR